MPRAYYKPFTWYEDAVGFKVIRRLTKVVVGLYFAGILIKIGFASTYSESAMQQVDLNNLTEDQQKIMRQREAVAARLREAEMAAGVLGGKRRGGLPPA